eukprot:CAMPEP_0201866352 /NCGR_PEP_ID=MMETSP0902-20130614/973_1 /ASSEMBLY_ACC=CAM_ASM_000551 /TAXON_ID=420261 /ORGANISM="Thalassiosira antarctica, Strain CCMP982" /LENGTH=132 /DNA_ID=CAMNT_0048391313 /DNA_START=212 /DNA_END=611 /DNA_ORIENTATION=-
MKLDILILLLAGLSASAGYTLRGQETMLVERVLSSSKKSSKSSSSVPGNPVGPTPTPIAIVGAASAEVTVRPTPTPIAMVGAAAAVKVVVGAAAARAAAAAAAEVVPEKAEAAARARAKKAAAANELGGGFS